MFNTKTIKMLKVLKLLKKKHLDTIVEYIYVFFKVLVTAL